MPKPDTTPPAPASEEEGGNIGDFTPGENTLLDDAVLDDSQYAEKQKHKEEEEEAPPSPDGAEEDREKEELSSDEDDFKIPENDDTFNLDDPLSIDLDSEDGDKAPKKKKEEPEEVDEIAKKKEGNQGLRDAIKEANDRAQQATGTAERIREERDALKQELDAARAELNDVQSRLSFRNPTEHPEVREIVAPWDQKLNTMASEMNLTGENGTQLKTMAPQLVRLMQELGDEGSDGYSERKEEIVSSIEENFPEDKKDVIRLISEGARTLDAANAKISELKEIGSDYEVRQANEQYNQVVKQYEEIQKNHFNPSSDLIASDPLNPKVILRELMDIDPQVKAKADQVSKFVKYAVLPLPPPNERELAGMDDDAAANYLQNRTRHHNTARERFDSMATEALLGYACLPSIYKSLLDAKEELKAIKGATPKPNDESSDGDREINDEVPEDVKDFAPAPANYSFD